MKELCLWAFWSCIVLRTLIAIKPSLARSPGHDIDASILTTGFLIAYAILSLKRS